MNSAEKLFRSVLDAPNKNVKKHITHEIVGTYCAVPSLAPFMLTEVLSLVESSVWEDRVCGGLIVEEMAKKGAVAGRFVDEGGALPFNIETYLQEPRYLASFYEKEKITVGRDFIDLEDHKVVLSLSGMQIPGMTKREENVMKRKKQKEKGRAKVEKHRVESEKEFYCRLIANLSSHDWEKRHGGALCFLSLFRGLAANGRDNDKLCGTEERMSVDEVLVPLLKILTLDRFNDYEHDVAVSPVRETASMALGEAFLRLCEGKRERVVQVLIDFCGFEDWQLRYSGLIGIKNVQKNVASKENIKKIVQICVDLLEDIDEDVKGIAAGILRGFIERIPQAHTAAPRTGDGDIDRGRSLVAEYMDLDAIMEKCWEAMKEKEDLAVAKSKIISLMHAIDEIGGDLGEVDGDAFDAILSCVRHAIEDVRCAVLTLLKRLPIVFPHRTLSTLLFSILAEESACIRRSTSEVLPRIAEACMSTDPPKTKQIVTEFLKFLCSPPDRGYRVSEAIPGVAPGETDVCVTDGGALLLGEDRIVGGRVDCLLALMSIPLLDAFLGEYFESAPDEHFGFFRYFYFAKKRAPWKRADARGPRGAAAQSLAEILLLPPGREGAQGEDVDSLLQLFASETCTPLLSLFALFLRGGLLPGQSYSYEAPGALLAAPPEQIAGNGALNLFIEKMMRMVIERKDEEEEGAPFLKEPKRPAAKELMGDLRQAFQKDKKPWGGLVLFELLGDAVLYTVPFASLSASLEDASKFLGKTVGSYTALDKLDFVFPYAMDECISQIVSHFISRSMQYNERFASMVLERLHSVANSRAAPKDRAATKRVKLESCAERLAEFFSFLSATLEHSSPSFSALFVFPLISIMNLPKAGPSGAGVRELAARAFSKIVPTMHLRGSLEGVSKGMAARIREERRAIDRLANVQNLGEYRVGAELGVELREYQRKGVSWLSFLKASGLNGILCDDMGLGKTIQVLAFLANEKHLRDEGEKREFDVPFKVLVLCPSSLLGHWQAEIASYFGNLRSFSLRDVLKQGVEKEGVYVVSYDSFRTNFSALVSVHWFYVVYDEGQLIKNPNTIIHSRLKMLASGHKVLLSGTPIQNSISELWALFDLLMPGYLGSEKEFGKMYARPILKGREGKGTEWEMEEATRKLEELHSKVLPFMLRRMKEAVLSDLPPKVIRDIYIEMEELQKEIYASLADVEDAKVSYTETSKMGGFGRLSVLRKACSHLGLLDPACIADPALRAELVKEQARWGERQKHPPKEPGDAGDRESELFPLSPKLSSLFDLLKMIIPSSNKALVFCQFKNTIDLIARDLLDVHFRDQKWARLDGSTRSEDRAKAAASFNESADVSVMLLTTQVGGLGLNLTGADTVIFFEHDWNPMADLQAMDRAHRIGQKKSVSVFRLIMKETIEESIMSLQRFKMFVSRSVVNQQNMDIERMDIGSAIERFATKEQGRSAPEDEQREREREEEYQDFV